MNALPPAPGLPSPSATSSQQCLRIAIIGSRGLGSHYGGIETMLDGLCPELARLGHRIDVYGRTAMTASQGVRAIRVAAPAGKHAENLARSTHALLRAMGRYDVIHFQAIGPGILSAATRLCGQPSLVTVHGLDHRRAKWGGLARRCLALAERTLVANASAISVVSESLRQYFDAEHGIACAFIPNGATPRVRVAPGALLAAHGLVPGRYCLFASRLTPEKACHDLIAAFNTLPSDMRLVVAGGTGAPAYLAALRAMADPARICFIGHRSGAELAELFSSAYAFILPSHLEGMSMALLEAVSYGLPVLASGIEENRAVLGAAGFYFPAGDVPALHAALAHLIAHPTQAATAARQIAALRQPNWREVAQRYDALYRAVCAQGRVATPTGAALPAQP